MSFIESKLKPLYPNCEFTTDAQGIIKVDVIVSELVGMLTRFHNEAGFELLNTISCTDWIEDGTLHLNYILYSYEFNETLFLKVKLPRELKEDGSKRTIAELPSVHTIWPQAANFERELWEMYGVNVTGHTDLREFFLEDWQGPPPNRRDFDTLEFVNSKFDFRAGREDAKSVKEERAKLKTARDAAKVKAEAEKAGENNE
jgi:NADH-quinone oxidoreductase subunit C